MKLLELLEKAIQMGQTNVAAQIAASLGHLKYATSPSPPTPQPSISQEEKDFGKQEEEDSVHE
jgi:hypothetical protein